VVAFTREGLTVVVPRLLVGLADDWQGTTVTIPEVDGGWQDLLTGEPVAAGERPVADLLARFPAAVLVAQAR
jgi:maltooligosyltrehalose synthase